MGRVIWQYIAKSHVRAPVDSEIPFLGIYPKDTVAKIRKDVDIRLFIEHCF